MNSTSFRSYLPVCAGCLAVAFALGIGCDSEDRTALDVSNPIDETTACPCDEAVPRTISFAGYTWQIRSSPQPQQAGRNCYCSDARNVWVDAQGRLHLRIVFRDGIWTCAEIFTQDGFGYGTYTFEVSSNAGALDRNVVLGLFTWDDAGPAAGEIREIDVEITTWSQVWGENTHFSIQPVMGPDTESGHYDERTQGVFLPPDMSPSTHSFTWLPERVTFASSGVLDGVAQGIGAWEFTSDNPPRRVNETTLSTPILIPAPSATTSVRINLWLNDSDSDVFGDAPTDGQEPEVVLDHFEFVPAGV